MQDARPAHTNVTKISGVARSLNMQASIKPLNQLLCRFAGGKTVALLGGGDPLVYGSSAWALEEFEDLNPVVVPSPSCLNAGNAAQRR